MAVILVIHEELLLLLTEYFLCFSEVAVEEHLQDISGKEGQSCTLSCRLSIPNVKTQWFKNGKKLDVKGRFTSEVKHKIQKLVIEELKPEDQGRYSCRYQNLESTAELWVEGLYPGTNPKIFYKWSFSPFY